jgi:hypothetical protein
MTYHCACRHGELLCWALARRVCVDCQAAGRDWFLCASCAREHHEHGLTRTVTIAMLRETGADLGRQLGWVK